MTVPDPDVRVDPDAIFAEQGIVGVHEAAFRTFDMRERQVV